MASSPKESRKAVEGVFAINKPQWASSAGVLRDLQTHFQTSALFAPWLDSQRRSMTLSGSKKRHIENLKVKLGHGGTLDPLATGVLIVGAGKGTKTLQRFLECTKSYECVVLFGAATDSYDAVGKIVSRAPHEHVTRKLVEEKLSQFRGKIMQKPSIFSALKVDGKKMYEYARAGGEVPEVAARPVEVHGLEMVEWLEPGTHEYKWPAEEVGAVEKTGAEKLMGIRPVDERSHEANQEKWGRKRSRPVGGKEDHALNEETHSKKVRADPEPAVSEVRPVEEAELAPEPPHANGELAASELQLVAEPSETPRIDGEPAMSGAVPSGQTDPQSPPIPALPTEPTASEALPTTEILPQPPAARLRMTVTSGFYVRSLCHDLGVACNSLGLMSSLIRSRQGDYELGKNVLEYSDLEAGEEVWEPKVKQHLEDFMRKEGWEAEEVEDEETWQANRKEREHDRREGDRDRSYQGKARERGDWKKGKGSWHKGNRRHGQWRDSRSDRW